MDDRRWQRLQELFSRAIELNEPERTAFLETECAADPELRAELERLLAADETSAAGIESWVAGTAEDLVRHDPLVERVQRDLVLRGHLVGRREQAPELRLEGADVEREVVGGREREVSVELERSSRATWRSGRSSASWLPPPSGASIGRRSSRR